MRAQALGFALTIPAAIQAAITPVNKAARIILGGMAKRKRRIIVGKDAKLASFFQRLMPARYQKDLEVLHEG